LRLKLDDKKGRSAAYVYATERPFFTLLAVRVPGCCRPG